MVLYGAQRGKAKLPGKTRCDFRYTKTDDWVFNPDDVRVPYKSLSTQHGEGGATGGIGGKLTKDTVPAYKSKGKIPEIGGTK